MYAPVYTLCPCKINGDAAPYTFMPDARICKTWIRHESVWTWVTFYLSSPCTGHNVYAGAYTCLPQGKVYATAFNLLDWILESSCACWVRSTHSWTIGGGCILFLGRIFCLGCKELESKNILYIKKSQHGCGRWARAPAPSPHPLSCPLVPLFRCTSVPVSQCPCVTVSQCSGVPMSRCPNVLVSRCPIVLVSHCPGVPVTLSPCVPVTLGG